MPTGPEIDPALVVQARGGDRSAFRRLVDALSPLVFNLAWRMTYRRDDAEDAAQEVFLRLYRHLATYDPRLPFLPWFRTLATNTCLTWRQREAGHRAPSLDSGRHPDPAAPPEPGRPEPSPRLHAAILRLPPEYRMVLAKLYFEGLGIAEIARQMDVPPGTVKTWLFRAREQLKDRLQSIENVETGPGPAR